MGRRVVEGEELRAEKIKYQHKLKMGFPTDFSEFEVTIVPFNGRSNRRIGK
jgi:hypothetical protein